MLNQQIKDELDQALKQQDKTKLSVLRNLWAEIKNKEIDLRKKLTDDEILLIIKKQVKAGNEAKEMFAHGGRNDLVSQNEAEIKILSQYLPAEVSEDELKTKVGAVIAEHPEITNRGQLIGFCIGKLKGLADSSRIAKLVGELS